MRLAGCNYGVLAPVFRDKEILQNLTCWSEWGSASVSLRQMTSPGSRVRYNAVPWCNPHSQIILHHLKFAFLLWNPSHNHNPSRLTVTTITIWWNYRGRDSQSGQCIWVRRGSAIEMKSSVTFTSYITALCGNKIIIMMKIIVSCINCQLYLN